MYFSIHCFKCGTTKTIGVSAESYEEALESFERQDIANILEHPLVASTKTVKERNPKCPGTWKLHKIVKYPIKSKT